MEAVILLQRCSQKRTFANRVEKRATGQWYKTWAFPIKDSRAGAEGYDKSAIVGQLYTAEEYPGCPYCKGSGSVYCGKCKRLTCWHGEKEMECQWCGTNMTNIDYATEDLIIESDADV